MRFGLPASPLDGDRVEALGGVARRLGLSSLGAVAPVNAGTSSRCSAGGIHPTLSIKKPFELETQRLTQSFLGYPGAPWTLGESSGSLLEPRNWQET